MATSGWQDWRERTRLLMSFVGELNSLQIHYAYTDRELLGAQTDDEKRMRIRWAQVGAIRFKVSEDLPKLSLTASQISQVMQLLLLLRNNDAYAEGLLATDLGRSNSFLSVEGLRQRVIHAVGQIQAVLDSIEARQPNVGQARLPLPHGAHTRVKA
jgi:hypothetical protein